MPSPTDSDPQTRLDALVEPICRAHAVELVDVRLFGARGGTVVRVIIDRPREDGKDGSGITVEDCRLVSRDLSSALDVHGELVPGSYHLEVSSPGLERPLVKPHDFERFAGREIRVRTRVPIEARRKFRGPLLGLAGTVVRISQDGAEVAIPFEVIAEATLVAAS